MSSYPKSQLPCIWVSIFTRIDLQKPKHLLAAYNDVRGVTAAFNLILHHLNRRFEGNFDIVLNTGRFITKLSIKLRCTCGYRVRAAGV